MTNTKTATTTKIIDRELTEIELDHVVGGDTALQHEATHADLPNNGGRPVMPIIAILIGC